MWVAAAHFLGEARWTENVRVLHTGYALCSCVSKHFRLSLASTVEEEGGGGRGGEGSSHPWQRVKGRVCVFPIVAPFHRDYSPVKIFSQLSDNDWKNHPTSLSLSLFPSFLVYFSILVNTAVQFRWKNYINRELVNWQIRRDVI